MTFSPAGSLSVFLFVLVVCAVAAAVVAAIYLSGAHEPHFRGTKTLALAILAIVGWNSLFTIMATSGFLAAHPRQGIPLTFACINIGAILFGFSALGRRIAMNIHLQWLVLFQGFRLPLELVLHAWSTQGTIPRTMTWTGRNFDILTGIIAIALFPFVARIRCTAWVVNVAGFALLVNVMRVAIFSSPLPFAWPVHPKLQLFLHFPYLLIGPTCIAGALAGHIILTRALLTRVGRASTGNVPKP